MTNKQPSRREQALDALRSGGVMAGLSLALAFPAALLILEGVLPETSIRLSAYVCAGASALVSELLIYGKRRSGYVYIPLSAFTAGMFLLLIGACIPMKNWDFRGILITVCVMTAAMTMIDFAKMNKNNKKSQKNRAWNYR